MRRVVSTRADVGIMVRELGDGPPVLFIHGWSLSGEVWDRQMRVVAESGHRAIAVDMRGHGGSDAPLGGYGIADLACDMVDVLESLEVAGAAVVGWSLGGMVGLRLGCDRPDLVRSLIMVASNGVAASRTENFPFGVPPDGLLAAINAAEHRDRIAQRRSAIGGPFKTLPDDAVLDWLHRISIQTPSWAGQAAMRTLLRTDQVHLLDSIGVPVTQIVGTSDPALSLRGAHWVNERLGGTLVELDAGHYPMLEQADEFDAALLTALGLRDAAHSRVRPSDEVSGHAVT